MAKKYNKRNRGYYGKNKGLKKFTVPYVAEYFSGYKENGRMVVFSEDKKSAEKKVGKRFSKQMDEPICRIGIARKWRKGERTEFPCEFTYY